MKKNGFTLIELLAVIVILSLIIVAMIGTMTRLLNNSEEKAYELLITTIENAAKDYVSFDRDIQASINVSNPTIVITIGDLYVDQLLTSPLINPLNDDVISDESTITITLQSNNELEYTINLQY
jgi:prepilin-type N-terminal cleavage/methylation domain-containing protein